MVNNDPQPYIETETVVPSAASQVSYGFAVARQATRMGLAIVASRSGVLAFNGTYTVIVETAVAEEPASGDWRENVYDSVSFNAEGTYLFPLTQLIFDKVRVRIETDAGAPARATLRMQWMADSDLTTLDPTV